jgi:hypothetical protein
MNYLYHFVPENMQGTVLYPLNVLKDIYPELYPNQSSEYSGREHVMEIRIPTLDCLWNDVLHFTAIHPGEVKQALLEAGRKNLPEFKCYQVDSHLLDPALTTVYLHRLEKTMSPENFTQYDPEKITEYMHLPEITKQYYKEMTDKGEKSLLFHRTPHILYKGSLDTKDLPIITV